MAGGQTRRRYPYMFTKDGARPYLFNLYEFPKRAQLRSTNTVAVRLQIKINGWRLSMAFSKEAGSRICVILWTLSLSKCVGNWGKLEDMGSPGPASRSLSHPDQRSIDQD
jgi:hypothetical protein